MFVASEGKCGYAGYIDETGNEHYFDRSTWKGNIFPVRRQLLKFTPAHLSCGTLVAKEVSDLLG
jgi:hypothetical protein